VADTLDMHMVESHGRPNASAARIASLCAASTTIDIEIGSGLGIDKSGASARTSANPPSSPLWVRR